jgi:hypothetical protein
MARVVIAWTRPDGAPTGVAHRRPAAGPACRRDEQVPPFWWAVCGQTRCHATTPADTSRHSNQACPACLPLYAHCATRLDESLITQRSQVQILPPLPISAGQRLTDSCLTTTVKSPCGQILPTRIGDCPPTTCEWPPGADLWVHFDGGRSYQPAGLRGKPARTHSRASSRAKASRSITLISTSCGSSEPEASSIGTSGTRQSTIC